MAKSKFFTQVMVIEDEGQLEFDIDAIGDFYKVYLDGLEVFERLDYVIEENVLKWISVRKLYRNSELIVKIHRKA